MSKLASPDAILGARVSCLDAATAIRTAGTSADATTAIAEIFWAWVSQPMPVADNRRTRPADQAE
ncbi:MAG: hypothetical protein IT555_10970 [Acetobacteraceae bacterium]|nr:hypothetical protein [Acetobacteraceae bacterium]